MASLDGELLSNGEVPSEFSTRNRMLEKLVSTPGANLHVDALLVRINNILTPFGRLLGNMDS